MPPSLIVALFFALSLRHGRAIADAVLTTFPFLTAGASVLLDRRDRAAARRDLPQSRDGSSPAALRVGTGLLIALAVHALLFTYYESFTGRGRQKGFGPVSLRTCAVEVAKQHQLQGHAFVSFELRPQLTFWMAPTVRANLTWDYVAGEAVYQQYNAALKSLAAMREYLEHNHVDVVVLLIKDRAPAVFDPLEATGEWVPIHYDDRSLILLRRMPETEALIQREGYRWIRPWENAPITLANASQVVAEAERALRHCPDHATFA